jgi:hypothetical protein
MLGTSRAPWRRIRLAARPLIEIGLTAAAALVSLVTDKLVAERGLFVALSVIIGAAVTEIVGDDAQECSWVFGFGTVDRYSISRF